MSKAKVKKTPDKEQNAALRLADHVLAVFEAGNVCDPKWPIARRELFEWANNPENRDKFYTIMVPKAVDMIYKHGTDDDQEFIAREERRAIGELTLILKETLAGIK